MEEYMNRRSILGICTMTALGFVFLGNAAIGAPKAKVAKRQLVGNWSIVLNTGTGARTFSPDDGYATFAPNGRFSITLVRSDLPKFASNNRDMGTADENKAVLQGSIAYFGTYSVNESDGTLTLHIERSSFPNWSGTDQKRLISTLTASELKYTNPAASVGGTAELT